MKGQAIRLVPTIAALALLVAATVSPAHAGAHSWRVSEAFSNADGSIWFVELWEYAGGGVERGIGGAFVISVSTTNSIDIASNLTGDTTNKFVLFGNQAFADLPGAPTPDQIVSGNAFFSFAQGERLRYSISGQTFDLIFPVGGLPTDGILSLQLNGSSAIAGDNTPTNYAGVSGHVDASGGSAGSGDVPLTMNKIVGPTTSVVLSWGASCESGDSAVGVYSGSLASLRSGAYNHSAALCGVTGTSATLAELPGDEYFMVVPSGTDSEGSYGKSSIGGTSAERPVGSGACETQTISCP